MISFKRTSHPNRLRFIVYISSSSGPFGSLGYGNKPYVFVYLPNHSCYPLSLLYRTKWLRSLPSLSTVLLWHLIASLCCQMSCPQCYKHWLYPSQLYTQLTAFSRLITSKVLYYKLLLMIRSQSCTAFYDRFRKVDVGWVRLGLV